METCRLLLCVASIGDPGRRWLARKDAARGGMGKLVCPWGFGRPSPIETAPSNKFGGATRISLSGRVKYVHEYSCLFCLR
jgi:hypothetical protein